MKISVVIPAYNEEKVIKNTLQAYGDYLSSNFKEYEIIMVDDGSTDKTLELAKSCKGVICISYQKNRGKGYAVKRGFLRATGDYIFFTDADLSYSPDNISRAIEIFLATGSAGVVGVRSDKHTDYTFVRRVISNAVAKMIRRVISTALSDTQCGFKGFEKTTAKQIFAESQIFDFGFDFEVIYLSQTLGKVLSAMPVTFCHRLDTRVRPIRDGFGIVRDLIYIKRRSINGNVQKTM